MFDLGWSEIALIAIVAFILLGPQDLVRVMRKIGYWTQRARLTLVTFQRMLDAAAHDEDIQRMQKDINAIRQDTMGLATAVQDVAKPATASSETDLPASDQRHNTEQHPDPTRAVDQDAGKGI